jgi:hypothetical protein
VATFWKVEKSAAKSSLAWATVRSTAIQSPAAVMADDVRLWDPSHELTSAVVSIEGATNFSAYNKDQSDNVIAE